MRFVVVGAGAIGGAVGARLFQQGFDVTLVARGEHGRALQSGLVLEAPGETVSLPIPTALEPADVSWDDDTVVLLAVKGQHTEHALGQLGVAPPSTPVVCMQNGVENERRVLRHFPHTYGMCVMCPATQLRPGVVQIHSAPVSGMLDLGRFPSGLDDRGRAIADAIAGTTFESVARPDIMRWKYRKLLMNLANAVEALAGPEGRFGPLARAAHREGVDALAAAGIDVAS
jgi:2-dehydropantoate 2-reductase